jgi:RNA polymerase sigma-70 factor, ECF subfamily
MVTEVVLQTQRVGTAALVRAAQGGDRAAFGALFEQFAPCVFRIALRRLRDCDEAQELCQDVFVQAMEKLDQLRDPACFVGWICAIAQRMAINRMTRRVPTMTAEPAVLDAAGADPATPLSHVLAGERCRQLRDGLARLGELDRKTLEAFYVEGRSLRQMCGDFRAPLGTIKRRLHVARKRLAKEVEPLTAV